MPSFLNTGSWSPGRRRLLELFIQLLYGRIEGLVIRNGEPVLDPPPRVIHVIKYLPGENGRRTRSVDAIAYTDQVAALFRQFDRMRNGSIEVLQIQNGLPFLGEVVGLPD